MAGAAQCDAVAQQAVRNMAVSRSRKRRQCAGDGNEVTKLADGNVVGIFDSGGIVVMMT